MLISESYRDLRFFVCAGLPDQAGNTVHAAR